MNKEFFATFAYPYMNGPMHLGHFFTMLKYYFSAHYRSMISGQEVFLPFGFHCTGMPIYANAMKLKMGDQKVKQILMDSGVLEEEVEQFINPVKWIEYFPQEAAQVLDSIGLKGWSPNTHFITTDHNPYYNKFVEWQMHTLKEAGVIYFADRPAIYSMRDNQPCAAHDRQTGEEAKPLEVELELDGFGRWCVKQNETQPMIKSCDNEWDMREHELEINGQVGTINGYLYDNYVLQKATGTVIFLPSERCVSRSGQACCVAVTGQWYLKYSDADWKRQVVDYIKHILIVHDTDAKKELLSSAEAQYDWCISREIGLGTDIPWDTKFKVDSLSDSTAYWAYYTVVERLQGDMLGSKPGPSGIEPSQLTIEFWNYVFERTDTLPEGTPEFNTEAKTMRSLFHKRMPMDLRVSGKDLTHNHLVMALFNGFILGEKFLPKEYIIGGYLKLNGQKMSKSTGNYITIKDAIKTYPRTGLIVALAEAGDSTIDANLRLKAIGETNKAIVRTLSILDGTINLKKFKPESDVSVYDKEYYLNTLRDCAKWLVSAYERGRFGEGLEHGWRKVIKLYEDSGAVYCDTDNNALNLVTYALYPIFPEHFSITDMELVVPSVHQLASQEVDQDIISLSYLRRNLAAGWKKCKNKDNVEQISIHENVMVKGDSVMVHINAFITEMCGREILTVPDPKAIHEKCDPYKVKPIFY